MMESRRVDVTMSWARVLNDECAGINPNYVYASRIHASSYQNDISLVASAAWIISRHENGWSLPAGRTNNGKACPS